MFPYIPIEVFGRQNILIIGSKKYIVSHEGDQNIIKQMRIEKVEQMQKPSGNIKFCTF